MDSRPVRILCLHGIGSNSEVFEAQTGMSQPLPPLYSGLAPTQLLTARLRYLLGNQYEFDFVDGALPWPAYPNIAEIFGHDQVYYSYCDDSPQSVRGAVAELAQYATENGPFDAVMGFSLGAALAMTLLLNYHRLGLSTPPFSCAILICGIVPCDWTVLEQGQVERVSPSRVPCPVQIPTVHCWSPEDFDYPGQSQELLTMCTPNGRVELVHRAGHMFPTDSDGVDQLAQAINTTVRNTARPHLA
ncbi:hypothetical protein CBS147346_1563 [Aspergillus niger]|nr:hypothetical protein CBS147346_1563 [Aspergillus niger]